MIVGRLAVFLLVLILLVVGNQSSNCRSGHDDSTSESQEDTELEAPQIGNALEPLIKGKAGCNPDWSRNYKANMTNTTQGHIHIDCGKCAIYNMQVRAMMYPTQSPNKCSGLTPELFSSSRECLWKNNCTLMYSPSNIVWSPPVESKTDSCLGEQPGIVQVGYSCLHPETPIDDVLKGYQSIEVVRGLIRSHNYGSKPPYKSYLNKHVIDITPPAKLRMDWKDYYAMLFVLTDISKGDKLTMSDPSSLYQKFTSAKNEAEECDFTTWKAHDIHNVSSAALRFLLQVKNFSSRSKGFDICFQWFRIGDINASDSFNETMKLCSNATSKQNGFPTFDIIKDTVTQADEGYIRSHSKYPWNYPRPDTTLHNEYQPYKWSSYVHVLLAPPNMTYLRIYVESMELGRADRLLVSGDKKNGQQ